MSRLEKLLQTLCPDGVEYQKLGDICQIATGKLNVNKQSDNGKYPFFTCAKEVYRIDTFAFDTEALLISGNGNVGYIHYYNGKFNAYQRTYVLSNFSINILFVKHVLEWGLKKRIAEGLRLGSVPYIKLETLRDFFIPLPPLPVQEEIVRILDTYSGVVTELEQKLEAEQAARTQQYEHYRHDLIFHYPESSTMTMEMVMLGEICHYSKESIDASEIDKDSYVGVDNLLQNKQGKVASEFVPEKGRLIRYRSGDVLIGNIRPYLKKIWMANNDGGTNGDVLCIQINDEAKTKIIPRFLYQILSSEEFFSYAINFTRGAGMPRGSKEMTMKFKFAIPPLEIQEQIVFILDRFDTLVNDLKSGLPAEIALRRKQYEYYRDKLLTFTRRA